MNGVGVSQRQPVQAVLFDLDGTLVDTETQTDQAVAEVAHRHGVSGFSLPPDETRGRTWMHVAATMRDLAGIDVHASALADELLGYWNQVSLHAKPLPGATD